jgi:Transposase IS116/IS110/IS902 family
MPERAAVGLGGVIRHRTDLGDRVGQRIGQAARSAAARAGEHVVDVPPTLSARVPLLGSTKVGKNDSNDALSTAIAGLRHCELRTVGVEDHTAVIRLLIDRYNGLVALRTQATCRLHAVLRELIAGGASRRLSANRAAKLLRRVHPTDGTAPIEASSGPRKRHRLNPRGNRKLNHAMHLIAVTQIRNHTPGRVYFQRKLAQDKSKKEALCALKRRISDAVWRQRQIDLQPR